MGILVGLAAMRSTDVGIDVKVYVEPYFYIAKRSTGFKSYIVNASTLEPGYAILNYIGAKFFGNISGIFGLSMIATLVPVYFRLNEMKDSKDRFISFLIYLLLFYNLSLNLCRQAIAISIIFWGSKFLNTNRIKFILCVVLAMSFHVSAIIGLALLVIKVATEGLSSKLKEGLLLIALLTVIVLYDQIIFTILPLFLSNSDKYLSAFLSSDTGYLSTWNLIFKFLSVAMALFGYRCLKLKNYDIDFMLLVMVFDLLLYILTSYNGNAFRYGLYFNVFTPVFLVAFKNTLGGQTRASYCWFVTLIYVFYFVNFNIISDSYGTVPYCLGL